MPRGATSLVPEKQGGLSENLMAQGFGQVSSLGMRLPCQDTLAGSTGLYTGMHCVCPGPRGGKEPELQDAGGKNFLLHRLQGSNSILEGEYSLPFQRINGADTGAKMGRGPCFAPAGAALFGLMYGKEYPRTVEFGIAGPAPGTVDIAGELAHKATDRGVAGSPSSAGRSAGLEARGGQGKCRGKNAPGGAFLLRLRTKGPVSGPPS
jgi:hypothetical protein